MCGMQKESNQSTKKNSQSTKDNKRLKTLGYHIPHTTVSRVACRYRTVVRYVVPVCCMMDFECRIIRHFWGNKDKSGGFGK